MFFWDSGKIVFYMQSFDSKKHFVWSGKSDSNGATLEVWSQDPSQHWRHPVLPDVLSADGMILGRDLSSHALLGPPSQ